MARKDKETMGTAPRRRPESLLALGFILAVAGNPLEANSLVVSTDAARAGFYGLAIRIDDPAEMPAAEAWVGIGPKKMHAEIALRGRLWIDPSGLTASLSKRRLAFLHLRPTLEPGSESVRLFLTHTAQAWRLGAEVWDDPLQGWVDAGSGVLTRSTPFGEDAAVLVEFEWGAASSVEADDGYLRVFRAQEGQSEGRIPVLAARRLRNGRQRIGHLQVGVVEPATQPAGIAGTLYLDDLALYRGPALDPDAEAGTEARDQRRVPREEPPAPSRR